MNRWSETEIDEMRVWDETHYAHVFATAEEYHSETVVGSDGDYLELATGERLLDFTSGLLCVNAGNRNPRIRDAVVAAMDELGFVWEGFANPYRTRAAKLILEDVLGPDDWAGRIRFTSSGSEAVELALLVAKCVTGRPNIISRDFAYHGWTLGALSVMGLPARAASLHRRRARCAGHPVFRLRGRTLRRHRTVGAVPSATPIPPVRRPRARWRASRQPNT